MEDFVTTLIMALSIAMLIAIVGVIRPFRGLSRGKFALIAAGCFVAVVIVTPAETPEEIAEREAKEKGAAEAAEAAALVAVQNWNDDVLAASKPCDDAMARLGEGMESFAETFDTFSAYRLAQNAKDVCDSAWTKVSRMDLPNGFPEDQEDKGEDATEACGTTLFLKREAANKAAEIFDGNFRNSAMAELQDLTQSAQAGTLKCVAGLIQVAAAAGVEIKPAQE